MSAVCLREANSIQWLLQKRLMLYIYIYMSIRKLTYYLEDAEIILRSDHLPLKIFLQRNTLNTNVINWVGEISPFKITFEYIKGIKIL